MINVRNFGAIGDGVTDDTSALRAVLSFPYPPQTTIWIPPNYTFLTNPLNLTSHAWLRIDGTIIAINGSNTKFDWPILPPLPSYNDSQDGPIYMFQGFIYAYNATNIRIFGSGTIHGKGEWWWGLFARSGNLLKAGRPNLIQLVDCKDIEITGITLRDSPFWCVHPVYCDNVWIHNITIRARTNAPNSDGIDPDSCRNVVIENNDIGCGDDHISIKAGTCGPSSHANCNSPLFKNGTYSTSNVTVRNNILRNGMGIAVGSATSGSVRHVLIENNLVGVCQYGDCHDCCGWSPALHVKTTIARGGVTEDIMFRNNTVYNTSHFILLDMYYQNRGHPDIAPSDYPATVVRNISFIGNNAVGTARGISLDCSASDLCQDISLINNSMSNVRGGLRCFNLGRHTIQGNIPSRLNACPGRSLAIGSTYVLKEDMEGA